MARGRWRSPRTRLPAVPTSTPSRRRGGWSTLSRLRSARCSRCSAQASRLLAAVAAQLVGEIVQGFECHTDGLLGLHGPGHVFPARAVRGGQPGNDEGPEATSRFFVRAVNLLGGEIGLLDQEVDHLADADVRAHLATALTLVEHRAHRVHGDLVYARVVYG